MADREIWLQIKSRKSGVFSSATVQAVHTAIKKKAARVQGEKQTQFAVGLEQPSSDAKGVAVGDLFNDYDENTIVCRDPRTESVDLIKDRLDTAEIIAEGIADDLCLLVADASDDNASLPFRERRRISVTEVDRRILERLEAVDPSAVDRALLTRALEPVDLVTSVAEPGFYQGVKARPGHLAAGLVLERPIETRQTVSSLKARRHLLITGPSGAGKSALMWLAVSALAPEFRWFQVGAAAGVQDADAIVRFIRSRRPNASSPIGLAFDEVGTTNTNLWDVLDSELRALPDTYLIGSIRREDVNLVAAQSDIEVVEARLDETLARSIWNQLASRKQTECSHWRESFEQSEGLMLEYVHLLTQGERLTTLIRDQVRQRERQSRHAELGIIRVTSVLCARGGEVKVDRLLALLDLSPHDGAEALKRLIDEHLVRESRPGVLGGLHMLRSMALSDASHDDLVTRHTVSLWRGLPAVTNGSLPRVIQSVLAELESQGEEPALQRLAEMLTQAESVDTWAAVLTGLGLGTLERMVRSFISLLERHSVPRAHWSLASMLAVAGIEVRALGEFDHGQSLRIAVSELRALPCCDLRTRCLDMLPEATRAPRCKNIRQANKLISSLVPIGGAGTAPPRGLPDVSGDHELRVRDVAAFLSTAYAIAPKVAMKYMSELGGERSLLALFRATTPWVTTPTVVENGEHGRTVRADWFYVAEDHQSDPHETVCFICETLIALSPGSDAAACDAVDPAGHRLSVGDFTPWSKNMPRENVPAKSRVAWNVAFRQILLARAAAGSLTQFADQMSGLVQRTERLFRSFSEKWINGKGVSSLFANEVAELVESINALSYAAPETPASSMTRPVDSAGADNTLGAMLTGVLGNLVPRMGILEAKTGVKAQAAFAGSLEEQAREHSRSAVWRMIASPPLEQLDSLANRLADTASILHEVAHDQTAIASLVKAAKRARVGGAVARVAQLCRSRADQRFRRRLRDLASMLKDCENECTCWVRTIEQSNNIYWPPVEVTILVEIADLEKDLHYFDHCVFAGQEQLGEEWPLTVVPKVSGQVVAAMAILASSRLPDLEFEEKWRPHIDVPFASLPASEAFEAALTACTQVSAIANCRDLLKLHDREADVLSKVKENFRESRHILETAASESGLDEFVWALAFLDEAWAQVAREIECAKAGQLTETPFFMSAYRAVAGDENDDAVELGAAKLLVQQAECRTTVA